MVPQRDKSADLFALTARSSPFLSHSNQPASSTQGRNLLSGAPCLLVSAHVCRSGADGGFSELSKSRFHKFQCNEQPGFDQTAGDAQVKGGLCP